MRITNDTKNKKYVGAFVPSVRPTSKARQNKGITLIALVITIIVMLILVAVTINMAINGGLFENAGKAVGDTKNATNEEQQLANGQITVDGKVYSSIDDYLAGNFSWTEILAEANANPDAYKHEKQLVSTYIGIGTDGNPVNMDLWNPTLLDDGTYLLGNSSDIYNRNNSYAGEYINGEIQGKVPQYIYNTNTNTFEPVTQMVATFAFSEIQKTPEFPTTVWKIFGIFAYCNKLETVGNLPVSVTNIERAFYNCIGLTSVTIPSSVSTIGEDAFYGCAGLTSITIPSSVTIIEDYAFDWGGLTSVTIPSSVTSIGSRAFFRCGDLTSIKVDEANTKYDSRDNCNAIIETSTNTLVAGCKNTTIPSSVTSIGNYAFSNCTGLTSVIIPSSVISIGVQAFDWCEDLTSVYFEHTTAPNFGSSCFMKWSGNKTTFYFKNSTVYDAFTTSYYSSSYGTKSTDYNW